MEFVNTFEVPLPVEEAWKVLLDVPRLVPCLPGAELTEVVGERTFKGKVSVRLGPVALAFAGTAAFEELDHAAHQARVKASGSDSKGRGAASAMVHFRLEPADAGSRVVVTTDLKLTGMVAQYGRGAGMIQSVADQLTSQFAGNLKAELARDQARSAAPAGTGTDEVEMGETTAPQPAPPARPISGFALMARVLWDMIRRIFSRGA